MTDATEAQAREIAPATAIPRGGVATKNWHPYNDGGRGHCCNLDALKRILAEEREAGRREERERARKAQAKGSVKAKRYGTRFGGKRRC